MHPSLSLSSQPAPQLGNQYREDWLLSAWLGARVLPEHLSLLDHALDQAGELAGAELYRLQLADRLNEPVLTQWSAWGERIDQLELTPLWRRAEVLAAEFGLVARGYDEELGTDARSLQFALNYLFLPSTDFYGCPLAMSDGAARVLTDSGNQDLAGRALGHLLARDPENFWTSGQWMTEISGGSDVSGTETIARRDPQGQWRLYGRKWFTSAANSQMALTLARPEGNPAGSRGLALFYLETRTPSGQMNQIEILRLKDKLGTRKVPTAELLLQGSAAEPVAGLERGVAAIAPMLNITRTWNAVTACALMRRSIALSIDYAHKRQAFGKSLIDQALHRTTLAAISARWALAFCAAFDLVRELGNAERGHPQANGALVRLLTPMVKLGTAKDAIAVASEALESFGGAGYIEDTGLPQLLRDAQVLSIWEGTTNVLALDLLGVIAKTGIEPWSEAVERALGRVRSPLLEPVAARCRAGHNAVREALADDRRDLESDARSIAMAMYKVTGLSSLAALAQDRQGASDARLVAAARLAMNQVPENIAQSDRAAIDRLFD